MALSYYSNWGAFQQLDPAESTLPDQLTAPQPELTHPDYNNFTDYQLFDPNDLFYSPENPNSSNPQDFNLPNDPFNCPKLQKDCDNYQQIIYQPSFYDGNFVQNPNYNYCYDFPGPVQVLPEFPAGPPVYSNGTAAVSKKETSLSAQSVAARQRRRKITVKTQELGKLVPGGHKMNTAEMLHAAYKYIKFLQAQVGILEFAASYHQGNGEIHLESDEEMKSLLESSVIQEKLYSSEKCLVPMKFVQEISSDERMVKWNPQLLSIVKQEH